MWSLLRDFTVCKIVSICKIADLSTHKTIVDSTAHKILSPNNYVLQLRLQLETYFIEAILVRHTDETYNICTFF